MGRFEWDRTTNEAPVDANCIEVRLQKLPSWNWCQDIPPVEGKRVAEFRAAQLKVSADNRNRKWNPFFIFRQPWPGIPAALHPPSRTTVENRTLSVDQSSKILCADLSEFENPEIADPLSFAFIASLGFNHDWRLDK